LAAYLTAFHDMAMVDDGWWLRDPGIAGALRDGID